MTFLSENNPSHSSVVDHVVIRFSGDSGDGMQLTGSQFSSTSALMGNDIATFPDFPAEIRAPQGTVAGVSGFQVHLGSTEILTPGDLPDILVAMNPAALKANRSDLVAGSTVIINSDSFDESSYKKAGYKFEYQNEVLIDPLHELEMQSIQVIRVPISSQTKGALESLDLDTRSKLRCKNVYALGLTYFMYSRDLEPTIKWIQDKFANQPLLAQANIMALKAGYHHADTIEALSRHKFVIPKAHIDPGLYRQISGNTALAYGLMTAAHKAGLNLFLGSYPITPASDILHELSRHKNLGVTTFQAEDEIAAIGSAIGASFAGALGVTTSSGPGIALKSEALNLAIMLELPLIVVDVQRGGPSTGLPTKTEQSDLNMALYGRNGESPVIVVAPKSPSDCFTMAYKAAKLSLEHMTPVVLLSDGYIANGSEPWKIPQIDQDSELSEIQLTRPKNLSSEELFLPYKRNEKLARTWALPGMSGFEHRLGGLEKQVDTGNVSYDPQNHETMVKLRAQKVALVADYIPLAEIEGAPEGELLLISWGGTYGSTLAATRELNLLGHKVGLLHLQYLNPLPKNLLSLLEKFSRHVVCELNNGQLCQYLNSQFKLSSKRPIENYCKIQGKPFQIRELVQMAQKLIK